MSIRTGTVDDRLPPSVPIIHCIPDDGWPRHLILDVRGKLGSVLTPIQRLQRDVYSWYEDGLRQSIREPD